MVMAEYASRPRTPIKVGFYDIVRTIGRGNFAVVKLARHRITKTEVAIKIIDKLRLDQLNLKKIYREIQILKLLNHQHIIKLYQVLETMSTIYLVCEYARNGELFDYITEQGHLPEEKARKMFWQALTAVEYCHKNNVVHRDLKAENLLLDQNNNIKLADFGFSNFFQSGSMLSTWCGSPPYAAPEVFEGKVYEGPQLDVWSLGVVLYVLVCGTFPFDGSNLATLKERVLGGRFRIPYWMSQDCENLVRRMLAINPKKRLTILQIKKHKWMQEYNPNLTLSQTKSSPLLPRRGKLSEYNEHVLKIMQGLGINYQKTLESLNRSAYDHLYAIYHLLADRLKLHRTSFPLETNISPKHDSRRRPSNVADQALAYMSRGTTLNVYSDYTRNNSTNHTPRQVKENTNVPDVHFDDMTTGLPTVQRTLANPLRYSSPPLPQIRTSMYEQDQKQEEENSSLPLYENRVPLQAEETTNQLLSIPNKHSRRNDEVKLGKYNLQQRRHTLMVPNPSQIQMLRMGIESDTSPHSSTTRLGNSGDEMSKMEGSSSNCFMPGDVQSFCEEHMCSSSTCECNKRTGMNFVANTGNIVPPFMNAQKMAFDKRKTDTRLGVTPRRRSGVSPLIGNMCFLHPNQEGRSEDVIQENQESKIALIMKERQLDASPVGFREGRRASDGLLLLGDNLLKERLQKLARAKAVAEMTQEDSEESWETEPAQQPSNLLQVPKQVNRCSSGDRMASLPTTGTAPVGSGGNIYFQPYNNNQSLARRRSLQVHLLQNKVSTPPPEPIEVCTSPVNQQTFVANQTTLSQNIAVEQATMHRLPEMDMNRHWSSWKMVYSPNPAEAGQSEFNTGTRQPLNCMTSGMGWQDSDQVFNIGNLSVASDESVPLKAAAAQQQQQRDSLTKPIRQQSLPITPTSTAHPFGGSTGQHHQSLAQILQQRRLQRRLKVATNLQQTQGYQSPLPELEQLRIDNSDVLSQFQKFSNTVADNGLASTNAEQDWTMHWGDRILQYGTAVHANEHIYYDNEAMLPLPGQHPVQEMLNFQNQQSYVNHGKLGGCTGYPDSPVQNMFTSAVPIIMAENFADSSMSWTYQTSVNYQRTSGMYVADTRTNSAEKLDNSVGEAMEFAMY